MLKRTPLNPRHPATWPMTNQAPMLDILAFSSPLAAAATDTNDPLPGLRGWIVDTATL